MSNMTEKSPLVSIIGNNKKKPSPSKSTALMSDDYSSDPACEAVQQGPFAAPRPQVDVTETTQTWRPLFCGSESSPSLLLGNAFDLIIVYNREKRTIACNNSIHSFENILNNDGSSTIQKCACNIPAVCCCGVDRDEGYKLLLEIVSNSDENGGCIVTFPIVDGKIQANSDMSPRVPNNVKCNTMNDRMSEAVSTSNNNITDNDDKDATFDSYKWEHDESALWQLVDTLKPGSNSARLVLVNCNDIVGVASMSVHLWDCTQSKVFVVDIDGTITRSNLAGIVDTILLEQYTHCHDGICEFLSGGAAANANLRCLYLTSRPLSLANSTRRFLSKMKQNNSSLPQGPLIGFPGSLTEVLFMELVHHNVHEYKSHALYENVGRLFNLNGIDHDYLYAAIGNTLMDMQAYHRSGLDVKHIYLIDKASNITCLDGNPVLDETDDNDSTSRSVQATVDYLSMRGTSFRGYSDRNLMAHFKERSMNIANKIAEKTSFMHK